MSKPRIRLALLFLILALVISGCAKKPKIGTVSGTLKWDNNAVVNGAQVSIGGKSSVTDANGAYSVVDLAYGDYTLEVTFENDVVHTQAVVVDAASVVVDITAPKPLRAQVSGTVVYDDATNAANVEVKLGSLTTSTDANGAFTFSNVKYADYQVSVFGPGQAETRRQVTVAAEAVTVDMMIPIVPAGNLFLNPTFAGAEDAVPPQGWALYQQLDANRRLSVIDADNPAMRALLMEDLLASSTAEGEIGIQQTVAGGPGTYQLMMKARGIEGSAGRVNLQLRFMPSNLAKSITIETADLSKTEFETFVVENIAPEGTTGIRVYVLTWKPDAPSIAMQSVSVVKLD